MQQGLQTVTEDIIQRIKHEFPLQAPQIVYRYCEKLAEQARGTVRDQYGVFVDYYGKGLVVYADGAAMAADIQAFISHHNASKPKETVAKTLRKHKLNGLSPQMSLPPDMP